ncbi:hypothetical protein [Epilithonimonas sp.]|uniref:hypothetical protein n=1 Tax=Epilithonimonas sp. TaxID=2894511 RepID=UPI00289B3106|nr:hypothetical protein [Epilithonimonas sp.]
MSLENLNVISSGDGILAIPFHSVFASGLADCGEKQTVLKKRKAVNRKFLAFFIIKI